MQPFERLGEKISGLGRSEIAKEVEGLEPIGWGFSRTSYRIVSDRFGDEYEGKVIKFGYDSKGKRTANKKEFETWMTVKSDKQLGREFSPIRDREENFRWIVMDYAEPVDSFFSSIKYDKKAVYKKRKFEEILQNVDEYLDIKKENMGIHRSRGLVFIDYPWGADFVKKEASKDQNIFQYIHHKMDRLT